MSPFVSVFVLGFCGDCKWSERVEDPTPAEQARVIRRAQAHERATGHHVAVERGQVHA